MLRLYTFGTACVADVSGAPLTGAGAQRRLVALLAVLAAARDAGISRDKLLALFWPETDPERARHALNQALYNARRATRCDDLFITSGDVRLNPSRISSDVETFERALACGDLGAAVGAYRGPFLDGFFIAGSVEFEQWMSAQRARFTDLVADALDRLARAAEARDDLREAATWRKRLVALNPLDSGAVVRLMTVLAGLGDRAGALTQAHVHELLLREHIDVGPDTAIIALAKQLRTQPEPDAPPAQAPRVSEAAVASVTESESAAPSDLPPNPRPRLRRWHGWHTAAALGAAVVAALVPLGRSSGPRVAPTESLHGQQIVVVPFRVSGADGSLGFLREGLVELLALRLADDNGPFAIDPGAVLAAWRASGYLESSDASRSEMVGLAARLGGQALVTGSVVGSASRIVLSASLIDVTSGQVRARESSEGPLDSLSLIVERVAVRLLAAQSGERLRLTRLSPPTLAALRAYLTGRSQYVRRNYTESVEHFERALREDSTFAVAALHLALAADRLNDAEQHDRAISLAWASRDALSEQDRAHLIAFAGPRYPAPSPEVEQLAAWEQAATLAPDRAEVWQELGERFFYLGEVLGVDNWRARASSAFRRALAIDPSFVAARRHLVLAAARARDTATLRQLVTSEGLRDSDGTASSFVQWRVAHALGDRQALARIRQAMPATEYESLRAMAMSILFDGVGVEDGERIFRIRRALATRMSAQIDAILAQHSFALNQGQPILALDFTEQLQELQPGTRAHLRLRVLDGLYGNGDQASAAAAAVQLARHADAPLDEAAPRRAIQLADVCVLEQWRIAHGSFGTAQRSIARLRSEKVPRHVVPVGSSPLACGAILEALFAVETGMRDALQRVRALDELMLTGPAIGDAGSYAHIAVARAYERLGLRESALASIRRRPYMTGWPRYLATARRLEGQLALASGDQVGARRVFASYLALRAARDVTVSQADDAVRSTLRELELRP